MRQCDNWSDLNIHFKIHSEYLDQFQSLRTFLHYDLEEIFNAGSEQPSAKHNAGMRL